VDLKLPSSNEEILLLHNPKCSKSRATLGLLEERGVAFQTRLYLENPLGQEELADLGERLGKPALEFTRSKQAEFANAALDVSSSEAEIFAAMAAEPILMERPILIRGDRAAIGRPPEDVLLLLND
jgi:arsenate reductase